MERDFLGAIGRKEKGRELKEETAKSESDYRGGAPEMQWQFPAKAGAAPEFMSFRSVREEDSKEAVFDHFSLSGFRPPASAGGAFDGFMNQPSPAMQHRQRQFRFDGQVNPQQYAAAVVHGHHAQVMDSYGASAHYLQGGSRMVNAASPLHPMQFNPGPCNPVLRVQSLPGAAGGSLFKDQCFTVSNTVAGSTVGTYGARDLRNLKSTQMTIFYNGSVNVFDNIPVEKAQQLMLLASRASIPSPPSASHKSDSSFSAAAKFAVPEVLPARQIIIQKPEHSVPRVSGISSPISVVSQPVTLPKTTSCSNNDTAGVPSVVPPVSQASSSQPIPLATMAAAAIMPRVSQASSSQPIPLATMAAAAIMPRAVPQARKASLTRFLEKRKERVSSVVPYPSSKGLLENSDTSGTASTPSKSPCTDIAPSSNNGKESMSLGHPRNISFSSEKFPSTKLHI